MNNHSSRIQAACSVSIRSLFGLALLLQSGCQSLRPSSSDVGSTQRRSADRMALRNSAPDRTTRNAEPARSALPGRATIPGRDASIALAQYAEPQHSPQAVVEESSMGAIDGGQGAFAYAATRPVPYAGSTLSVASRESARWSKHPSMHGHASGAAGHESCAACNHGDGRYRPILGTMSICSPDESHCSLEGAIASPGFYGVDPQEYIFDGGDREPRAVVLNDGSLIGLQPEDTVVQFSRVGLHTEQELRLEAIERFMDLPGVTPVIAAKFADAGYRSNDDIASIEVKRLIALTGWNEPQVAQLITIASDRAREDARWASGSIEACTEVACRAAIYAPRFAAVRKRHLVSQAERAVGAIAANQPEGLNVVEENLRAPSLRQPIRAAGEDSVRLIEAFRDRNRGVPVERVVPILDLSNALKPFEDLQLIRTGREDLRERAVLQKGLAAALAWSNIDELQIVIDGQSAEVAISDRTAEEAVVYELHGKPQIRICKIASQQMAEPGDEVDFTIRLDNVGDRRVENVVVSDSLPPRLEYVEDSQSSSLELQFTTEENEAGSKILRWKIIKDLKPGEGGYIRFRCRVR